jgi:hypothetical protein
LARCFEGDLSIGGVTTTDVFWVNRNSPVDKVFLGMPFIMRNQVNFFWSGNRRIVSMNTEHGTTEMAMHPRDGPLVTVADFSPVRQLHGLRLGHLRLLGPNEVNTNQRLLTANSVAISPMGPHLTVCAVSSEYDE